MEFDEFEQVLSLKIVYYGPALGGKTTNLLALHDLLPVAQRGDLVNLDTHQDRTLFFDLLPFFLRAPSGLRVRLKVYTVPGQVRYDATRKAVLSGADGVVFVADSQIAQQKNNAESLLNLETNCRALGMPMDRLALVIQFNKRDLGSIVSEAVIQDRWGASGITVHFASALHGRGVGETFIGLCRTLFQTCDREVGLSARHGLPEEAFLEGLGVPQ